jgi:hypothetical protein
MRYNASDISCNNVLILFKEALKTTNDARVTGNDK